MRLLLDLQGAQGGSRHSGLGRYSLELARALVATRGGHDVLLLLNAARPESAAALEAEFAPLLGAGSLHRFTPPEGCEAGRDPHHTLRRLAEHIRAQVILGLRPDMVHLGSVFEGWNDPLVTNWPAELERPRHVATLHDLIPLSRRAEYLDGAWRDAGLVPWYMRQFIEIAGMDGLLCNSEATRQEGLRLLDMPAERLVAVGGGVSAGFAGGRQEPAPIAGRYVLCLGLNDLRKNEARLIQAMGLLRQDGLRLVVTGSAPEGHLRRLATEAGLPADTILHLGLVDDAALPALYAHAALFVLPSLAEGFGLPLAEAMMAGAPFAASRAGALPEVAGRDDVLFDPLDVADIARVMGRILGDAALAEELRRFGPAQAARLGWPGVASRAWAAMESWAGAAHPPRPSLAITGPLPPQPTGVADYSAELLPALSRHYAITLVSAARPAEGVAAGFPWLSEDRFAMAPHAFSRVLHHLGNSALHHGQHSRLLRLRPAVSVLHDVALPEYRQWAAKQAGAGTLEASLYANHGYPALLAAQSGDAGMIAASLLMSGEVVTGSLATIVHSQAARGMLEAAYGPAPAARVHVVPHLRRMPALPGRAEARARLGLAPDALVVASFGACVPKKLPLRIIEAFAAAGLGEAALLTFVGAAQPGLEEVMRATARAQGLVGRMRLTGPVTRPDYEDWLAAADLAVQLRGRHQGESSGAVVDAMAAGLACIVNARGSLAELPPGAVLRLSEDFADADLAAGLRHLARDVAARQSLGDAARDVVARELRPEAIAEAYRAVIEASHSGAGNLEVLAAAARLPAMPPAQAMALGTALAAGFPLPRQACLFVAQVRGWRRDDFAHPHEGRRPEPVTLRCCTWHTDHAGLAAALGMDRPVVADRAVVFQPGDALIGEGGAVPPWVSRLS